MKNGNATWLWKGLAIACMTGFIGFWGGYGLKKVNDDAVIQDHEARVRVIEKAIGELSGDVREIKTIVKRLDSGK